MAATTAVSNAPQRLLLQGSRRIVDIQVETILPPGLNPEPETVASADRGFPTDPLGNTSGRLADSPGASEASGDSIKLPNCAAPS